MEAPGKALEVFRQARDLSQKEAAEKVGLHGNTIGAWERGESFPRLDSFDAYLEALNVPVDLVMDLLRDKTATPIAGIRKAIDYLRDHEKLPLKELQRIDGWRLLYGEQTILDAIAHGPD